MDEELRVSETPIDTADLFWGDTVISLIYKGHSLRFTLREADDKVDGEFQRRAGAMRMREGKAEVSDDALRADVWLFDQLIKLIEVVKGNSVEPVSDVKTISPDLKRRVVFHYRDRIR